MSPTPFAHDRPRHVIPHAPVFDLRGQKELTHRQLIRQHDAARVTAMSRLVSAPEVVEGCQPFPGFTNEGYGADLSSRDENERVVIEMSGKHGIRGQFGRGMQMKRVGVL